jgi:DNA-binding NarL/FixJ family response regulator
MTIRVLTKTEEEVARLAATGFTEEQIASRLDISTAAVAAHVSGALRKLGARTLAELAELVADAAKPPRTGG